MKKMNCANLHGIGDLRYETAEFPSCGEDEVILQLKCCGICGSDLPRVFSKGTYHFPTVPGHEFAGTVFFDPKNELTGKGVAVFPLLPCFECESCKKEQYATCEGYDYYGSRRDGGMSEYLAVKRWNLLVMPEGLSYREGAMCEPVSVARHAVRKLGIRPGETLLISGAGPIGLIAGQWAKAMGVAQVFYFDIDARKVAFAKTLGFAEYSGGEEISCALEGTGCSEPLSKCLKALSPGGRMVLMGNPSGEVALSQNHYWHILRKELTLLGTWNSSFRPEENDWKESLAAMAEGRINVKPLVTHAYPLEQCGEAFEMMRERTEFYLKVMLTMNEEK